MSRRCVGLLIMRIVVVLKFIIVLLLASRAKSRPRLSGVRQTRGAVFRPTYCIAYSTMFTRWDM